MSVLPKHVSELETIFSYVDLAVAHTALPSALKMTEGNSSDADKRPPGATELPTTNTARATAANTENTSGC